MLRKAIHTETALERAEITQLSNAHVVNSNPTFALERAEITQLSNTIHGIVS